MNYLRQMDDFIIEAIKEYISATSRDICRWIDQNVEFVYDQEDIQVSVWRLLNEVKLDWTSDFKFKIAQ